MGVLYRRRAMGGNDSDRAAVMVRYDKFENLSYGDWLFVFCDADAVAKFKDGAPGTEGDAGTADVLSKGNEQAVDFNPVFGREFFAQL